MLIVLESALGCFIALVVYRVLFGVPGPSRDQIIWLGAKLEEIEERLPERLDDELDGPA